MQRMPIAEPWSSFLSIGKFILCGCISFHWLSIKHKMKCHVSSHRCDYSHAIGTAFVIIWEMFHGRISLNSIRLLLLVNFVSGFRLELMYISLSVSIRSMVILKNCEPELTQILFLNCNSLHARLNSHYQVGRY